MNTYTLQEDRSYHVDRKVPMELIFENDQYLCPNTDCNKQFKTKAKCSYHFTISHFRKLKCPLCEFSCGSLGNIRQHFGRKHCGDRKNRTHWTKDESGYHCNKCSKTYKNEPPIAAHVAECYELINKIKYIVVEKKVNPDIGTREEVYNGSKLKTSGGLFKKDLFKKNDKYISKKNSEQKRQASLAYIKKNGVNTFQRKVKNKKFQKKHERRKNHKESTKKWFKRIEKKVEKIIKELAELDNHLNNI